MTERILSRNPNCRPDKAQALVKRELSTLGSMSLVHPANHRRHFVEKSGLHGLQVRLVDMPWYWLRTATVTGTMCLKRGVDRLADSQRPRQLQGVLKLHGYRTSGLLLRPDAEARSLSIFLAYSIKPLPDCIHFKRKSHVSDTHQFWRDPFTALTTLFTISSTYTLKTQDGGQWQNCDWL